MAKQKIKKVIPNISFTENLLPSRVMVQFDNNTPKPITDLLNDKSQITFELLNTQFSSLEFIDEKTKKKFKIFMKKKES